MKKRLRLRGMLQIVLPVFLVIGLVYFLSSTHTGRHLTRMNVEELSDYLRSFGAYSIVLGMLAVYIQVMLPIIPFVLVAGANVLVFGLFWGFVINFVMAVLGAFTGFFFARYYGHERVEAWLSKYPAVKQFNKKLEQQGFFYVLLGRMIPVIPSTAISLGAGITKIRTRDYFLGTLIGKLPIILLESFIGHDLLHFHEYKGRLLILCGVFIALLVIGSLFKNKLIGKVAD